MEKKLPLLACLYMMRILKMFEGRLFITQMENTDRKCLTLEKRRDLRKWLCLGILGFGIFGGKNA